MPTKLKNVWLLKTLAVGAIGGVFCLLLWLSSGILAPFILGALEAYLWQPLIRTLDRWKIHKGLQSLFLTLFTYIIISVLLILFALFIKSLYAVISLNWKETHLTWALPLWAKKWLSYVFLGTETDLRTSLNALMKESLGIAKTSFSYVIVNGWIVFRILFCLFMGPIIGFYLMMDGGALWGRVQALIPNPYRASVCRCLEEVDASLSCYIRGQVNVALALSLYYALGLYVLSVPCGISLGLLTGLMSFIPYVGFTLSIGSAFLLSIVTGLGAKSLFSLMILYGLGYGLEAAILVPFFIGRGTGLHPVIILFAVFLGGALKGMAGILMALPLAIVISALWRVFSQYYEKSAFMERGLEALND